MYIEKYLKYKTKYLNLKNQLEMYGSGNNNIEVDYNELLSSAKQNKFDEVKNILNSINNDTINKNIVNGVINDKEDNRWKLIHYAAFHLNVDAVNYLLKIDNTLVNKETKIGNDFKKLALKRVYMDTTTEKKQIDDGYEVVFNIVNKDKLQKILIN